MQLVRCASVSGGLGMGRDYAPGSRAACLQSRCYRAAAA